MQEAVPYKTWLPMPGKGSQALTSPMGSRSGGLAPVSSLYKFKDGPKEEVTDMVKVNAVIVIGKRGCCMTHVVKRLLQGLGVNPPVREVEEEDEDDVVKQLESISCGGDDGEEGRRVQLPVVFIGGQLFGGLDRIIASHITGELTPILKKAGALWL